MTTTGTSASFAHPSLPPHGPSMLALGLALSGLPGQVLLGRPRKQNARLLYGLALLCVLITSIMWSGCGGGTSMGNGGGVTPAGTYNLTVVGTFTSGSANLAHSSKLTLVVQ